jgi:hypothetical protein
MPAKRKEESTSKAPATRKPAIRRKRTTTAITPEHVAVRAYYLHLEGGTDPDENWIRAERELSAV